MPSNCTNIDNEVCCNSIDFIENSHMHTVKLRTLESETYIVYFRRAFCSVQCHLVIVCGRSACEIYHTTYVNKTKEHCCVFTFWWERWTTSILTKLKMMMLDAYGLRKEAHGKIRQFYQQKLNISCLYIYFVCVY